MEERTEAPVKRVLIKNRWLLPAGGLMVALIVAIGLLVVWRLGHHTSPIPTVVAQQAPFPLYVPSKLPNTYHVTRDSFNYEAGVLVFKAEDSIGDTIAFTEQQKPKNLNFATFYSQQFSDTKNLDHVPFPSVSGRALQSRNTVLSIVTNDTWLLISSQSPLTQEDMTMIAQSLKAYSKP